MLLQDLHNRRSHRYDLEIETRTEDTRILTPSGFILLPPPLPPRLSIYFGKNDCIRLSCRASFHFVDISSLPRYAIFSPFGRAFGTIRPFLSQPANALRNAPPGALAFPGASLRTDKNHKRHSGIPGCNARARARACGPCTCRSGYVRRINARTLPLFWSRRNFPAEPHIT